MAHRNTLGQWIGRTPSGNIKRSQLWYFAANQANYAFGHQMRFKKRVRCPRELQKGKSFSGILDPFFELSGSYSWHVIMKVDYTLRGTPWQKTDWIKWSPEPWAHDLSVHSVSAQRRRAHMSTLVLHSHSCHFISSVPTHGGSVLMYIPLLWWGALLSKKGCGREASVPSPHIFWSWSKLGPSVSKN